MLAGNAVAVALLLGAGLPSLALILAGGACLLPALLDGSLQALSSYRSTAPRRLATGVLAGFGQIILLGGLFARVIF